MTYRGCKRVFYRAHFICYDDVIVELQAARGLSPADEAQVINYTKAGGTRVALLLNFGEERLRFQRLALDPDRPDVRRRGN